MVFDVGGSGNGPAPLQRHWDRSTQSARNAVASSQIKACAYAKIRELWHTASQGRCVLLVIRRRRTLRAMAGTGKDQESMNVLEEFRRKRLGSVQLRA